MMMRKAAYRTLRTETVEVEGVKREVAMVSANKAAVRVCVCACVCGREGVEQEEEEK